MYLHILGMSPRSLVSSVSTTSAPGGEFGAEGTALLSPIMVYVLPEQVQVRWITSFYYVSFLESRIIVKKVWFCKPSSPGFRGCPGTSASLLFVSGYFRKQHRKPGWEPFMGTESALKALQRDQDICELLEGMREHNISPLLGGNWFCPTAAEAMIFVQKANKTSKTWFYKSLPQYRKIGYKSG